VALESAKEENLSFGIFTFLYPKFSSQTSAFHTLRHNPSITRKLCYRKDDRAMRPVIAMKIFSLNPNPNPGSMRMTFGLQYTKSEGVGLIVCAISFQDFRPM